MSIIDPFHTINPDSAQPGRAFSSHDPKHQLLAEIIANASQQAKITEKIRIPVQISQRWQILDCIGQGGMSTVYKARHLVMNKVFAVKILNPELTAKKSGLERFHREARAASSLNHPNVVTVHDCGATSDEHAFLVMDYLDGQSLADTIQKEGKLVPERALPIFVQTCEALAHAHEHAVIHRDLKPSNIMLLRNEDGSDFVKIVDFGIAKLLDFASGGDDVTYQRLTNTGDIFGSPLYMSPEQCSGQQLDARSDIYSMGCLMYETLIGKPPFIGANALETMYMHLHAEILPLTNNAKTANKLLWRLHAIMMKCLAKDAGDRYQDMAALRKDLILARDEPERRWQRLAAAAHKPPKWSVYNEKLTHMTVFALLAIIGLMVIPIHVANIANHAGTVATSFNKRSLWAGSGIASELTNDDKEASLRWRFEEADLLRRQQKTEDAANLYRSTIKEWKAFLQQDLAYVSSTKVNEPDILCKAEFGLGLCQSQLHNYSDANLHFQRAIKFGQDAANHGLLAANLLNDIQLTYESNLWQVHPVMALLRCFSNSELVPPGAS